MYNVHAPPLRALEGPHSVRHQVLRYLNQFNHWKLPLSQLLFRVLEDGAFQTPYLAIVGPCLGNLVIFV